MSQQLSFEAWAKGASVIRVGLCPEFDALEERELVKSHWPNPRVPPMSTALASGMVCFAPCSLHHKVTMRKEPLSPLQDCQALFNMSFNFLEGLLLETPELLGWGSCPHCQTHGIGKSPLPV